MSDLTRTFICPLCGYDGFRCSAFVLSGMKDANVQWGCPICMTKDGIHVTLEETSDPRDEAAA